MVIFHYIQFKIFVIVRLVKTRIVGLSSEIGSIIFLILEHEVIRRT